MAAMDDQELRLELHGSSSGGGLTGCREAVEVLTRVPKNDVNKDGVKVAMLTFMESAWRLGETVVELNDREGRARILKAGTISLASFTHALARRVLTMSFFYVVPFLLVCIH
jgi:hypothetical protein